MSIKRIFLNFMLLTFLTISGNSVAMDIVSKMTPKQKIGQIIMLDFRKWKEEDSKEATSVVNMCNGIIKIIKEFFIGNIIFFAENFVDENQTKELVQSFKDLQYNDIPMLFAVDQEGGKVQRIRFNVQKYKDNGYIESNDEAYQKGYDIGKELSELGINCNLAPVADVNSNPNNSVIGTRSFGSDPNTVAERCEHFIKGLSEHGILSCLKHYPGHGDTSKDTHSELATVLKTKEELEKCELIPFIRNINNADMIMTAHISLPKIDAKYPATLSKDILDIIKKFKKVIISDAMVMGAIAKNYGTNEACKLAIDAGVDILCMPMELRGKEEDERKLTDLYDYLIKEMENNPEFKKRVDESVEKILELKNKMIKK